ncbi:Uma2 family endonuclease [Methylobacterium sp. 2A]|jgi:Uma2 family endonuclease|uniref:Uma2 family endonuclease n=1 Tax=Methylobacterium sp. 2A TaxID=2603816 RepID=UPI0013560981|nr:Uma2 family endonuclease [Methylobacterium sp. 2A]MWV21967.1 Uma2 family endonuclease [Methylobacterium sp. 2A]
MAEAVLRQATYADLEAVPEHRVAEIIDGVLETHPRGRPPLLGATAFSLAALLGSRMPRRRNDPDAWIFMSRSELRFGPQVLVPDLAGWRRQRLQTEPQDAFITTPPDWVCEIVSPATVRLDRGRKRRIYGEAGVGHLWLLDPAAGVLEGFALADGRWVLLATIQRGETVALPPFDAVPFPFDDLFPFDDPAAPALPET